MSNKVAIYSQYITGSETIVEVPEGYTADDIKTVHNKWNQPTITMNDGKVFGPSMYSNTVAELDVVSQINYFEEGDDFKRPEYISVSVVEVCEEHGTEYDSKRVYEDGVNLYDAKHMALKA